MKIYLACLLRHFQNYKQVGVFLKEKKKTFYELESFFEIQDRVTGHSIPLIGQDYFLDSGAFSATYKEPIDIYKYIQFISKYNKDIYQYACLDVIPQNKSPQKCAEQTLENQNYMESIGLNPLPVYHKAEPFEFLEYYIDNYDYICIGGVTEKRDENIKFLDGIWSKYLTHSDGTPKCKVHAFGLTAVDQLVMYPWYSCDSSTALYATKVGKLNTPQIERGKINWQLPCMQINVSDESRSVFADKIRTHVLDMDKKDQETVQIFLDRWGFSIADMNVYWKRLIANIGYWIDVQDNLKCIDKFKTRQHTFL